MKKQVTERDIRLPQFKDAELNDLEFDSSGEVVRKDRFEKSMRKIQGMLHGVNGLSARSGWTCEQVVEAVKIAIKDFEELKAFVVALKLFPIDAEFYHPENKEYIKNIDQEMLEMARNDEANRDLINFDYCKFGNNWETSSAFIDYINVLMSKKDLEDKIIELT